MIQLVKLALWAGVAAAVMVPATAIVAVGAVFTNSDKRNISDKLSQIHYWSRNSRFTDSEFRRMVREIV